MTTWLLPHILTSTALALAVALACRLGRFRPALCHALWLVVLLKLVVPPMVAWPWSPQELAGRVYGAVTNADAATVQADLDADNETAQPILLRLVGNARRSTAGAPSPTPRLWHKPSPGTLLLAVWIGGALVMAGIQAVRLRRVYQVIASGRAAPAWLEEQVQALCADFGLRTPKCLLSLQATSVFTWGMGRPRIIIPDKAVEEIGRERWRGVIAHELGHLKRRDHWAGCLELLAGCLWWWYPVFWYARRRLHEHAETACDAWVVWALPDGRRNYADALVRAVEFVSERPAPAPVLGMGSGAAVAFERRLVMVLREYVPCRMPLGGAVFALLLAALVLPGWSETPAAPTSEPATAAVAPEQAEAPTESALEKKLDSPVSIEFEDVHVKEILAFISDTNDINLLLDYRVVPPRSNQVSTDEIPPAATAATAAATEPTADTPETQRNNMPTATPEIQPGGYRHAYVTDGMIPYINLRDTSLRDMLTALLRPLNLTFTTTANVVVVSSPSMIEADAAEPRPAYLHDENLSETLKNPISIEFQNIHLFEILEFISDSYDVNLVPDWRVIAPQKASPSETVTGSPGYVTDGIVPYVRFNDLPMGEALEVMLRILDLTYRIDRGFVWISTHELITGEPVPQAAGGVMGRAGFGGRGTAGDAGGGGMQTSTGRGGRRPDDGSASSGGFGGGGGVRTSSGSGGGGISGSEGTTGDDE